MDELIDTSNNAAKPDDELVVLLAEADRRRGKQERIFFVRHFLRTFDPRPTAYPHHLDFDPYGFQEDLIEEIYTDIKNGVDLFIEKSRDMGVTWIVLAVIFWMWLYEDGFQALLGSYIEDYVDNGEMDSLFGKIEYFCTNNKDPKIMPRGFNIDKHLTYMSLTNPVNGNAILGKAPTKKFSRSGRYTVVLYDEIGYWAFAKQSWTAGGDATNCRIAITTPPDEPSYAKYLRFSDKIKVLTLHWRLHPDKDDEWYEHEKGRRTEEEVLHELDISWEYSISSRVYSEVDNLLFERMPYNPALPLYVSLDLGLDAVAVGWWQPVQNSHYWTLVDSYEKSDNIIDWWYPFFGFPIDAEQDFQYDDADLAFIEKVKRWKRGIFFGDPSGEQRHIESKVSAYTKLRKKGIYVQSNTVDNDFKTRRDATKLLLPKLILNDTPGVHWWLECMKLAHYPKRAEESNSTSGITKPVHDFTSHLRTMTEFFAVNYESYPATSLDQSSGAPVRKREYDPKTGRLL